MVSAKRKTQRIYTRHCPVFLILPSRGHTGFCWNPRAGVETGRIVLPGYTHSGRMLQSLLWVVLGDFRLVTSKAAAGIDFMTSDTLAAAYATVRWNYRKRSKEICDKASINNQETDRKNWRRHYNLYMRSAYDAGKNLFHKCPELYDSMLKYVELPDGVERLRKG